MADFKSFDECDALFRNSKGKVKQAPELPGGTLVADTHCHLGMLENSGLALARAASHNIGFICCINDPSERPGTDEDSTRLSARQTYDAIGGWLDEAASLLESWGTGQASVPRVRFACGVHPHNARLWDDAKDELVELLERPETCCLGEIGLDYHYDLSPRDVQRDVFAKQLHMASDLGLPVSLHLREAHADALEILHREGTPEAGCIVHCFNLGSEDLAPFLELGCYIAFGGPLTFKKSWYTRLAALDVPLDRLLTETDAPYMAPEPLRGTVCTPDMTIFTLRMLLDCLGYAGAERACELVQPREIDRVEGEQEAGADAEAHFACSHETKVLSFTEAQCAERIYRNALDVLDRQR